MFILFDQIAQLINGRLVPQPDPIAEPNSRVNRWLASTPWNPFCFKSLRQNLSMWRGYESEPDIAETLDWFRMFGASTMFIHTSRHASPAGRRSFARSVRPKMTAPGHAVIWDKEY